MQRWLHGTGFSVAVSRPIEDMSCHTEQTELNRTYTQGLPLVCGTLPVIGHDHNPRSQRLVQGPTDFDDVQPTEG